MTEKSKPAMAEPRTNPLYTTGKGMSSSHGQLSKVCMAASGFCLWTLDILGTRFRTTGEHL